MKILVPVKRVIDFNVRVRVKPDGSGVETDNVKMSINPFDEISVEAALRLREAGIASEVIAISVGTAKSEDVLRTALAMGADRAVLVEAETGVEPLAVAKILKAIADTENPGLVIVGKQAIDDDCNQTGQMLSALMGCALATYVSSIEVSGDAATVVREIDGGLQTLEVSLPAVVTTDLRLNEPRYASLPNIMKARQKPIERMTPADLGVDVTPRLKVLNTRAPQSARNGVIVGSVADLVDKLKSEAGVI